MSGEKRKHVVFDEPGNDAAGSAGVGPSVHPDRAAAVDAAQPPAKKPKSAKKLRYIAKKTRKQRRMKKAKRAAEPKGRLWNGEEESSSGDESDSDDDDSDDDAKAKASAPEPVEQPAAGPSTASKTASSSAPLTEAEERARRKAEKRAKRDERREERKARRKAERKAAAARAKAEEERGAAAKSGARDQGEAQPESREEAEASSGDESDNAGEREDADVEMNGDAGDAAAADTAVPDLPQRLRTPSPPPLEPFPLPRMAPAPDAAVLSRQGMPAGLADATFVDQSLRVGVNALAADLPAGGLSERTQRRLADLGVEDFFAVQAAMLPHLLSLPLVPRPHAPLSDYLISAPTGSGKTLAYAIPVIETLAKRVVPRLRALIVLPTRDLVVQVRETLEALAKGTGLLIGSVTGQHSFAHEQAQLVDDDAESLLGGSSKLDILIATPGRLMDHLAATPNFTLQHLRFLVIDEADRLLTQSFQNWLAEVLAHTRPPTQPANKAAAPYDAVAGSWVEPLGVASGDFEGAEGVPSTCQKLLFSATLTRDPAKVAALDLSAPQYFIVQGGDAAPAAAAVGSSFALPAELAQRMLILPPALKPLNLIHLLHAPQFAATPALVFTKSVEAATRLVRLLEFFEDAYIGGKRLVVRAYTRDMAPGERKRLLADFAAGAVDVVVCSDLVARGIDLPTVEHVVSYDVPIDMTKYVHRAGRTARAGRAGTAWTLVEKQEALHFKGMLKAAAHEQQVKKVKVKEDDLAPYRESYDIAMKRLREVYRRD